MNWREHIRPGKRVVLFIFLVSLASTFVLLPAQPVRVNLVAPTDASQFAYSTPDALSAIGLSGIKLEKELCWTHNQQAAYYDFRAGKEYSGMDAVISVPNDLPDISILPGQSACVPALQGNYSFSVGVGQYAKVSPIPVQDRPACVLYGNESVENCSQPAYVFLTERLTLKSRLLLSFGLFLILLNMASNMRTLMKK